MEPELQNQVTLTKDAACVSDSSPVIDALEKHLEKWYGVPNKDLLDKPPVGLNKVP